MIPYIIKDDFLNKDIFYGLKNNFDKQHLFEHILQDIAKNELYNHRLQLRDIVHNKRCNHSDNPDDCFCNIYFVTHKSGHVTSPHLDNSWKLLSSVLYVSDEGDGTIFIDNDKEIQIEWKPNRLVSFIPSQDSWHKYQNTLDVDRQTVTFFYGNKISENKIK